MPSTDSAPTATITVSAVAPHRVDRSFLYRHHDLRSQILALAGEPEPHPCSTRTSRRVAAGRPRQPPRTQRTTPTPEHQAQRAAVRSPRRTGLPRRRLIRTDEIGTLRERVTELEQELLDRRQDLQDRDDEVAAAGAANRDLMITLNDRTR